MSASATCVPGTASATPTDTVRLALRSGAGLPTGWHPDVVLSGINFGQNIGAVTTSSGTVSAAVAALANRVPAIAFSAEISFACAADGGQRFRLLNPVYAKATTFAVNLLSLLRSHGALSSQRLLGLNVNYPFVGTGTDGTGTPAGVAVTSIGNGEPVGIGYVNTRGSTYVDRGGTLLGNGGVSARDPQERGHHRDQRRQDQRDPHRRRLDDCSAGARARRPAGLAREDLAGRALDRSHLPPSGSGPGVRRRPSVRPLHVRRQHSNRVRACKGRSGISGSDRVERVFYSSSVHDEREIAAVVEVLRSGPQGLWPGRRVTAMERQVAALFGKEAGVMVNSGSSALFWRSSYSASNPAPRFSPAGSRSPPTSRRSSGPDWCRCSSTASSTRSASIPRIEEMITPRTGALLIPNLIGNAPDWDAIRGIADAHHLPTIEDSCDTLGPLLRGRPTGERSPMTVTSFANSHILTCGGNGGMLLLDDDDARDRALMLRRWGRRSEVQFFGTRRRERDFWEDVDGIRYDNQFIFDELGWNFEPSEMGAAFGLEQLKKLEDNLARRRRTFERYTAFFADHETTFCCLGRQPNWRRRGSAIR